MQEREVKWQVGDNEEVHTGRLLDFGTSSCEEGRVDTVAIVANSDNEIKVLFIERDVRLSIIGE